MLYRQSRLIGWRYSLLFLKNSRTQTYTDSHGSTLTGKSEELLPPPQGPALGAATSLPESHKT